MTAFWGTSSAYAPGLLGNDFYDLLTWVDNDSTVNIAWAAAFDASKSPVTVPQTETAVGRPGIAGWPQGAIVAWSGTDGSSTLNLAGTAQLTEYDPIAFSQKATLWGQSAPAGPGVAWGNGRLYLVRADSSGGMHLGWSTDPLNADAWSFTELPDTAIDAPAISTLGPGDGDVWIAWTGTEAPSTWPPGSAPVVKRLTARRHLTAARERFFTTSLLSFKARTPAPPDLRSRSMTSR